MAVLFPILGILLLLVAVLLVRAAQMGRKEGPVPSPKVDFAAADAQKYAQGLSKLVQVPTVSHRGQQDLTEFDKLHSLLEELFPLVHKNLDRKLIDGSYLYHWKGKDPSKKPILFMAHIDVVPADAQGWKYPPFSGTIAEGKVWGRGTLDSKCNVYSHMQAVEELLAEGFLPPQDIYLAASNGEEITGDGAPKIVAYLKEHGVTLDLVLDEGGAIISEVMPGVGRPFAVLGVVEKGYADVCFTAKSRGGHSSTPPAHTPVARLADFVHQVEKKSPLTRKLTPDVEEMFRCIGPDLPFAYRVLLANLWLFRPLMLWAFPKMSSFGKSLLQTSCAFTMTGASEAPNVIPDEAFVVANMRTASHQGVASSVEAMRQVAAQFDVETEVIESHEASACVDIRGKNYQFVSRCVAELFPDVGISPYVIMGATDARHYVPICDSAIRFYPVRMDNQQVNSSHAKDENIDIDALTQSVCCIKYMMEEYGK